MKNFIAVVGIFTLVLSVVIAQDEIAKALHGIYNGKNISDVPRKGRFSQQDILKFLQVKGEPDQMSMYEPKKGFVSIGLPFLLSILLEPFMDKIVEIVCKSLNNGH